MLTDIIVLIAAFAGGWYARERFGSYSVMKAWVKDLFPKKPDA